MNARNCQLCGKPLSRLRVGGDGDFCSKDHRNQFRLRAGMDRLVEVNKVASLMRRRESARPILASSLIRRGETARHDFGDLLPTTTMDMAPRQLDLRTSTVMRPRLVAYSDTCVPTSVSSVRGIDLAPRTHPGDVGVFAGRGVQPAMRPRRHSMTVSFPRHGATGLPWQPAEFPALTREFVALPPAAVRADLGRGPEVLRKPGRIWLGATPQACPVSTRPAEGNALRVSAGVSFRVPKVRPPEHRMQPRTVNSLLPVERAQSLSGVHRDSPADPKFLAIALAEIAARVPAGPRAATASGFNASRPPSSTNGRMLRDMPAPDPRAEAVRWAANEPKFRPAKISQTASGFARRNGARLHHLAIRPNLSDAAPQVGTSPFVAREDPCVPRVPYCNVLAAAVTTETPEPSAPLAPERELKLAPVAEVIKYEEHFDSGWDNWVGGVADWKVDVAGVRTGSLALYLPTLDLSDYDLEFLARIDTHSVNWVVRAAGAEAHLRCTVTAVEGGQLEFSRAVVQGGVAEAPVVSSMRVPGKPRTTFTVRMSAAGPIFSITIDGKTIDSWVDDRLATGGIGFMGAPDDRARLYWVRVSSPSAPSKEHTLQ